MTLCLHHFDCSSKCSSGQRGIQRASSISSFEGTKGSGFPPTFCVKVGHGGFVSVEIFCFCDCLVRKFSFGCEDFLTRWRWKAWKAERCRDVTRQTSLFLGTCTLQGHCWQRRDVPRCGEFFLFAQLNSMSTCNHSYMRSEGNFALRFCLTWGTHCKHCRWHRRIAWSRIHQYGKGGNAMWNHTESYPIHTQYGWFDDTQVVKGAVTSSNRQRAGPAAESLKILSTDLQQNQLWATKGPHLNLFWRGLGIAWAIWKASCQFPRVTGCHLSAPFRASNSAFAQGRMLVCFLRSNCHWKLWHLPALLETSRWSLYKQICVLNLKCLESSWISLNFSTFFFPPVCMLHSDIPRSTTFPGLEIGRRAKTSRLNESQYQQQLPANGIQPILRSCSEANILNISQFACINVSSAYSLHLLVYLHILL